MLFPSRSPLPSSGARRSARARAVARRAWLLLAIVLLAAGGAAARAEDPLPSWNEGPTKARLIAFVEAARETGGKGFIPPEERVAVFDNDGTLWCEQPIYVQFAFMIDQVKVAAPRHPEWKGQPAFEALAARDREALARIGQKPILQLLASANSGMSVEDYDRSIRAWLASARHPRFHRPYTDLVYRPMQEVLTYLRASGFKTFIVSGGSVEFMRPWAEEAYGVPPEQVVGTISRVTLQTKDGAPSLVRAPEIEFVDDGPGKPVGIYRSIGRRPVIAFGNSDGDLQMLQYTATGDGPRLAVLVHHTDAEREYAYDRQSKIGKLDKALDEARAKGWTVVDMKADWKRLFPGAEETMGTGGGERHR